MALKVLISVFILCTFSTQNVLAQIGMGPLNIKLVKVTHCPADEDYLKMEVVDVDGKDGLSFDINLPYPLDNSISYTVSVDKVQNGQIQKGVFKHGGNYACEDMQKFLGEFWNKLLVALEMPAGCPSPPGHYQVDKFPFEEKDIGVKTFLYGRFLMNAEIFKDKSKKVGCVTLEFTNSRPGESV